MSENAKTNPLAEIEAFEAAAFRIGQLARRLRTNHPDLPVRTMEPTAWVLAREYDVPDVHAELEIRFDSVAEVHALATALGVEVTVTISPSNPYERAVAQSVVDGVMVKVAGTRALVGDEYAAWQVRRDQATGDGEGR